MNRDELISKLEDWAGLLGPFITWETYDDLENIYDEWYNSLDEKDIDIFIDIILNPPNKQEIEPIDYDQFIYHLVKALATIGRRNTKSCIDKLQKYINIPIARVCIIDVLGNLKQTEGIGVLRPLLEENLTDEEIISLASALWEIGGLEAKEILEYMEVKYKNRSSKVTQEIFGCLKAFRR